MYLVCNWLLKNTPKYVYMNHSCLRIIENFVLKTLIYQRDLVRVKGAENVWLQDSFHLFLGASFLFLWSWKALLSWIPEKLSESFFFIIIASMLRTRSNQEKWNYLFWIFGRWTKKCYKKCTLSGKSTWWGMQTRPVKMNCWPRGGSRI